LAVKREEAEEWGNKKRAVTNRNRIMIYGPKNDGTYVVEFKTADGEELAISVPRNETAVLKHFQERMPYGLFVPDNGSGGVLFETSRAPRACCLGGALNRFDDALKEGSRSPALSPFRVGFSFFVPLSARVSKRV
jgi:hypothetical protein